jgi:hypothetical protein
MVAALPRLWVQALIQLLSVHEVLGTLQEGQVIPG